MLQVNLVLLRVVIQLVELHDHGPGLAIGRVVRIDESGLLARGDPGAAGRVSHVSLHKVHDEEVARLALEGELGVGLFLLLFLFLLQLGGRLLLVLLASDCEV